MQQSHTVSCVIYRNRFIDSDGMDLLAVTHRFKLIHAGLSSGLMYLISSCATGDASMILKKGLT